MSDTPNADFYTEGTPIFLDSLPVEKVETPHEEPAKAPQEVVETPDSHSETEPENVPFHKHPRWKKMMEERDELSSQLEETRKMVEELKQTPKEETIVVPQWWKEQYGEGELSEKQYKQYLANNEEFKENLKQELKRELDEEKAREEESRKTAQAEADTYVTTSLQSLHEEGRQFDDNALLKFMLDFETEYGVPIVYTDGTHKGSYNFEKALELMQKMTPQAPSDVTAKKKEIASESMNARPTRESSVPIINRQSLRNGDWRDITKTN